MQIIQVIDLDGTTVKVDETNPSEPKIVSALQFDVATRKAVPIAEVAELIFAKPLNANVEAVCIGYKGVDGKHYGLVDDMFAPVEPTPEPAPVERNGFIELTIPSDYAGNPELKIRPRDGKGDNFNQNELYNGADLNNGIYVMLGDNNVYHFTHVAVDDEGVHTLRADKVYREPLDTSMLVQFGTSADVMEYMATLNRQPALLDGLNYAGGMFRIDALPNAHIRSSLTALDHL
jgi:hypothetical protein|nr:MAG TPA: hypothetical protein [Bacteriophage sp.]